MVVDDGDRHLSRLGRWGCLLLICVTNIKDIYKVKLSIIMRHYIELQVLDISIVS